MVSVIVPVYNSEKYVNDCIISILNQTFHDLEVIIVNDGSTDNSLSICKSFCYDERVKVIDKINGGVSSARNKGIEFSTGDFLMFVDSDDFLPKDSIEKLVDSSSNSDMVVGQFKYVYDGRMVHHRSRLPVGEYLCDEIKTDFIDDGTLSGFLIGSSQGALFLRSIVVDKALSFNPEIKINEDGLFNYCYVRSSNNVRVVDHCVYYVRKHDDSSTHTRPQNDDYNLKIKDFLFSNVEMKELPSLCVQFERRNVSIAMWNILLFAKLYGLIAGVKYVRNQISSKSVVSAYETINVQRLSHHKKVFYFMMKRKMSFSLYLCSKYVIPFLSPFIER